MGDVGQSSTTVTVKDVAPPSPSPARTRDGRHGHRVHGIGHRSQPARSSGRVQLCLELRDGSTSILRTPAIAMPAAVYTVSLSVKDEDGMSTTATTTAVVTAVTGTVPAAPTGLNAVAGNAQIVLPWTAVTGAASYNIYRSTTSGGEGSTPYQTGVTSSTFTDTGLTNGTTYYYEVAAVNSAGPSAASGEASAISGLAVAIDQAARRWDRTWPTPITAAARPTATATPSTPARSPATSPRPSLIPCAMVI